MKNLVAFSIVLLLFVSCDPQSCSTHYIDNRTDNDIVIKLFSNIENGFDTNIMANQKGLFGEGKECGMGGGILFYFEFYDSIVVSVDGITKIKYTADKVGKNIYNYDYWDKAGKNKKYTGSDYVYTFEITEEDLNP